MKTRLGIYEIHLDEVGAIKVLVHDRVPARLATDNVDFHPLARSAVEEVNRAHGLAGEWIDVRVHRERVAAAVERISDARSKAEAERDQLAAELRRVGRYFRGLEKMPYGTTADTERTLRQTGKRYADRIEGLLSGIGAPLPADAGERSAHNTGQKG